MSINRLHLDFTIEDAIERKKFVDEYLSRITFSPTNTELETIANYILYGKDNTPTSPNTQKTVAKNNSIDIKTRYGTWDTKQKTESLEALLDSPAFNEASLNHTPVPYTKEKLNFSRNKARAKAPPKTLAQLENLWRQIDVLDYTLALYDWRTGKRKEPPRSSLRDSFTPSETKELIRKAKEMGQYQYLKGRHQLVELRRQQYTLKDTYEQSILVQPTLRIEEKQTFTFEEDILVFPLGLVGDWPLANPPTQNLDVGGAGYSLDRVKEWIFRLEFDPAPYTEEELRAISNYYWEQERLRRESKKPMIDFRNIEDVYQIFLMLEDLEESSTRGKLNHEVENNTKGLISTLMYYMELANLTDVQKEVGMLKARGYKNQEIVDRVEEKYGHRYMVNYISTIFRQKTVKGINEAAQYHWECIGNLFFPENFKKCSRCGTSLLINQRNFVKKHKSADGFDNRCKKCDKEIRSRRKKKKENLK